MLLRSLRRDGAREDRRDSRVVEVESVRVYPSSGHSSVSASPSRKENADQATGFANGEEVHVHSLFSLEQSSHRTRTVLAGAIGMVP